MLLLLVVVAVMVVVISHSAFTTHAHTSPPPEKQWQLLTMYCTVQAVALCPPFQPGIALAQGTFWQGVI
jgi:hypothetical protein